MPPAPLPKKKDNRIDENEAKLIGDFFVTVGKELSGSNAEMRATVIKNSDSVVVPEYYYIDEAKAEYKIQLDVGSNTEGAGRKRTSEVVLSAEYKRVSGNPVAPMNVLSGVIAPAERNRKSILSTLRINYPDKVFSDAMPIFHLGGFRYWAFDTAEKSHYVIELEPSSSAKQIKSLEELTNNLDGMFKFLESQLSSTYSGS